MSGSGGEDTQRHEATAFGDYLHKNVTDLVELCRHIDATYQSREV